MRNKVNHVTAVDHSIDSLLALYKELPAGTRLTDLSFSELLVGLFFSRTQVAIENARNELAIGCLRLLYLSCLKLAFVR